jgi:hypothetical protein
MFTAFRRRLVTPATAPIPASRRRIAAVTVVCATALGFAAVAATPAQASGAPLLLFSSSEVGGTLTVTDSVPSMRTLNYQSATRITVQNLKGVPIAEYSGENYTGQCVTHVALNDSESYNLGSYNGWGPASVAINLTCGQWPGNLYGTPITIDAITSMGDYTGQLNDPIFKPSGMVLDVPNGTRDGGARTVTWTHNGGDNQRWYLKKVGTIGSTIPNATANMRLDPASLTAYKLISVIGNDYINARCLEAAGATPQIGAVVETYPCDPNAKNQPNQLWLTASNQHTQSQDSFPDWAGPRTSNQQVSTGERMSAWQSNVAVPTEGLSNEWFNGAMLSGNSPANYPVLTESSDKGNPVNGSTLTMENQIPTLAGLLTQSWWIGAPSGCVGLYSTCGPIGG